MRLKIKELVKELISKYETHDPFRIIKELDGIIVYVNLVGVRGFYQNYKNIDIIYIDENLSKVEQRIVCAHELGHMLLHKNKNYFFMDVNSFESTEKLEIQANLFSAELLIEDEDIVKYKDYDIHQIASMLEVNESLIYLKYINMNYLY